MSGRIAQVLCNRILSPLERKRKRLCFDPISAALSAAITRSQKLTIIRVTEGTCSPVARCAMGAEAEELCTSHARVKRCAIGLGSASIGAGPADMSWCKDPLP